MASRYGKRMGGKILIVDDNPFAVLLWSRHLVAAGFVVQAAADGVQARALVAQWSPDLVLLDAGLPEAEGLALCREWRAAPCGGDLCIVIASAGNSDDERDAARAAGADECLAKVPEAACTLPAQLRQALAARTAAPLVPSFATTGQEV